MLDLDRLPASVALDLIYCLLLEETKEGREHREQVDAHLDAQSTGKPDRATWGKLPQHQRAMRAAQNMQT